MLLPRSSRLALARAVLAMRLRWTPLRTVKTLDLAMGLVLALLLGLTLATAAMDRPENARSSGTE